MQQSFRKKCATWPMLDLMVAVTLTMLHRHLRVGEAPKVRLRRETKLVTMY